MTALTASRALRWHYAWGERLAAGAERRHAALLARARDHRPSMWDGRTSSVVEDYQYDAQEELRAFEAELRADFEGDF